MIAHAHRSFATRPKNAPKIRLEDDVVRRIRILLDSKGIARDFVLDITHSGGVVTLRGEVADSHEHWRCLECCRHVPGVRRVVDGLAVSGEKAMLA